MGDEVKYQSVLRDILHILVDRAASSAVATGQFDQGVRMGNFEAVATILNALQTFGIVPADVDMDGFDSFSMLANVPRAKSCPLTDGPVKLLCRSCNQPVIATADYYEVQEQMHWLCFHFEFEHEGDPDVPCGDPSCPWGRIQELEEVVRAGATRSM